jgi:hypothetical protein
MKLRSRNGWVVTVGLVAGIAAFTLGGSVYADGNGCLEVGSPCPGIIQGTCAFLSEVNGDFCACKVAPGHFVKTCECSTGEYPPCGPIIE